MAINNIDQSVNVRLPDKTPCLWLVAALIATCQCSTEPGHIRACVKQGFLAPQALATLLRCLFGGGIQGSFFQPLAWVPGEALALTGQPLLLAPGQRGTPPWALQGFCTVVLCRALFCFYFPFVKKNTNQKPKQIQYNTLTQLSSYIKRGLAVQNITL